jgi:hypothetical protein
MRGPPLPVANLTHTLTLALLAAISSLYILQVVRAMFLPTTRIRMNQNETYLLSAARRRGRARTVVRHTSW